MFYHLQERKTSKKKIGMNAEHPQYQSCSQIYVSRSCLSSEFWKHLLSTKHFHLDEPKATQFEHCAKLNSIILALSDYHASPSI